MEQAVPLSVLKLGPCLGGGSGGSVFKSSLHGEDVAVKLFEGQPTKATEMETEALQRVGLLRARIMHDSTESPRSSSGASTAPVGVAMKLFPHESLQSLVNRATEPLTGEEVVKIAAAVAAALAKVHGVGVVHGDVSLDNVLVEGPSETGDYTAHFIDFGSSSIPITQQGTSEDIWGWAGVVLTVAALAGRPSGSQSGLLGSNIPWMSSAMTTHAFYTLPPNTLPSTAHEELVNRAKSSDPSSRPSLDEILAAFSP